MALQKIQFIPADGRAEWAVIPIEDYTRLCDNELVLKQLLAQSSHKPLQILPEAFASRLTQGESPIRLWREYRRLSQQLLAEKAGISIPYLSQLEHKIRSGSKRVLKAIAQALGVDLETIID